MQIYIVQPGSLDYNDNNYSVYPSNEISYVGLDPDLARKIADTVAENRSHGWGSEDVEGASSERDVYSLLLECTTVSELEVVGAHTAEDLDEQDGERVVWVVVEEVYDQNGLSGLVAAYRDPQQAAERVRVETTADTGPWSYGPRAVPVKLDFSIGKVHTWA